MLIAAIAALTAIAIVLALFFAAVQNQKASMPKHISFALGVSTHGNESSELYALGHGIRYFRTDISMSKSQEALLNYEHEEYNASYLGILDYETLQNGTANRNWSLSGWNQSVESAVGAYPFIYTWEIWNEPLVQQFQTGYMNGSAYNYYMMIKSAYAIIKAREPNATIICFGGAPVADNNALKWYIQVWNYGASKYCDAVSLHAYPYGPELLSNAELHAWKASIYAYENLTGKPIWITEFGMPASSVELQGYTPMLQKQFLAQSLSLFSTMNFIKRAYWYDLWGLSDGALGNDFGMLNASNPNHGVESQAWKLFIYDYFNSS